MQDETTNLGAAKVILTMLRLSGLLVKDKIAPATRLNTSTDEGSDEETEVINTMEGLDIAPDWEKRNLILFGDGLSQVRARAFEELIQKSNHLFGVQHDMKAKLKKVMSQVVHITGDLHGGNFHFLSAVYSLFYGSLIQPIQLMLGWKRIRGSDVTKCYQQAAGLALMIADAIEKHLFGTYCVETNKEANQPYTSIRDPANFSLEVAKEFHDWCDVKLGSTTDEVLRMLLGYTKLMRLYRLFRVSVHNGDAVMIECSGSA